MSKTKLLTMDKYILKPFIMVCFVACITSGKSSSTNNYFFQKEIDTSKHTDSTNHFTFISKMSKALNLENIEGGFDSLQIRIWYAFSFVDSAQLVLIKRTKGQWAAKLMNLKYNYKKDYKSEIFILAKTVQSRVPKSSWEQFIQRLNKTGMFELPDCKSIPGYYISAHANGVILQISEKHKYRIYGYSEPSYYKDKFVQAHQIMEIVSLIGKEFNFYPLVKKL